MTDQTATIRAIYDAFATGDIATVLGALDPKIEWIEAAGSAYAGTYTGTRCRPQRRPRPTRRRLEPIPRRARPCRCRRRHSHRRRHLHRHAQSHRAILPRPLRPHLGATRQQDHRVRASRRHREDQRSDIALGSRADRCR